jgi:hypothetical protein
MWVGHGHDNVGVDRMFARELAAHFHPRLIDVPVGDGAVGPGEIDIFENAERAARLLGKCLNAFQAVLVDDNDFARLDVADEPGVNQVERAGLAGEHPAVAHPANGQRSKSMGVAHADKFLFRHDDE